MNIKIAKFIASLAIGCFLLVLTFRYFDLAKTLAAIRGARIEFLVLALLLLVIAYLLRGSRWMIWEPGLKYWDSFKIILVGFMGNNILPARLGELLRAHCAAANIDNSFGRTATLASIAIERILDGFVIALFGILGLLMVPLEARLSWALTLVCILFFMLTAGLILGNYFHLKIRALFDKIHDIFPGHLTSFGKEKVSYFLDGLLLIRKPGTMISALGMTFIIWGVELISYYLISCAVIRGTEFNISLIFLAVVNFASLFPFTVGGLGAIEGATTPFLINAGLPFNESLAMVLIQHGFQFFFTTAVGGIFYFTNKYYDIPLIQNSKKKGATSKNILETDDQVLHETRLHLDQLTQDLGIPRKQKRQVDLSIVIPAYNEKNRLPRTILETIKWCKSYCPNYEIIVVDDGSADETLEISKLFSEYDENVKVVANPHLGKGAAVRSGMLNAVGRHVLFMDADGATPLDEITKLRAKLDEGSPIAIGSRIVQDPGKTMVVTSFHRKFIGRAFAAIVNLFGVSGIGDTQCGFKMFRGEAVKDIFSRQKLNGFAFDVEILFLARKLSLEISEVPVNWENKEGSKVNLVLDSLRMLRDVLKLKVLHRNT
jgi:dolichyl-phosphate beta-glucosyltransferase